MALEETHSDHLIVIHPATGRRFRLRIRGDVGRLSIGKLKDCLALSRCDVPRAAMQLCFNGILLRDDRDVCADIGIRTGSVLTVEEKGSGVAEAETSAPARPKAALLSLSSSSQDESRREPQAGQRGSGSATRDGVVALNSLPRRQLELQTLDAQEDLLHHARWRREAAIDDTLNELEATLAKSSAKKSALALQRERAEREWQLIAAQEKELETEKERIERLKQEEARRAAAREDELAARRAELRREQDAIRAVALLKRENELRLSQIAYARDAYEANKQRAQEEQAALDAQYREGVLDVARKQLALEQEQIAQQRKMEELAWERRLLEEQRAAYFGQTGTNAQREHVDLVSALGSTTPRPSQRAPASYPYPSAGTRTGTSAVHADPARQNTMDPSQGPAGMNHSQFQTSSPSQASPSSPLRYDHSNAGAEAEAAWPRHAHDATSDSQQRSGAAGGRRQPGDGVSGADAAVPDTVERPSIRHQNDGLSVSRETESPSHTTHNDLTPATPAAPVGAATSLGPGGRGPAPATLSRHLPGLHVPTARNSVVTHGKSNKNTNNNTDVNTSASTAGDRFSHLSSGATSFGPSASRGPLPAPSSSLCTHPVPPPPPHAQADTHQHGLPQSPPHHAAPWHRGESDSGDVRMVPGSRRADLEKGAAATSDIPSDLVMLPDGGYYDPEENAVENLQRLGDALGFVGEDALLFDRNRTCIVNLSDAYTLLITYDPSTERLYVYATLLTAPSLQHDDALRLGLYEMLLEGSLLGREVCGGGISASLKKDFILMSTSLFMPTSQPWSLRTLVPSFLHALQHWREQIAAYLTAHGHAVAANESGARGANVYNVPYESVAAQQQQQEHSVMSSSEAAFPPDSAAPRSSSHRGISVLRHETPSGLISTSQTPHQRQQAPRQQQQQQQPQQYPQQEHEPHQRVREVPVLGVDVTDSLVVNGVPTQYKDGVLVLQVAGPAALAGLQPHDFIEQINGVAVGSIRGFGLLVRSLIPGTVANLRIVRGGLPMMLSVQVGASQVLL